MQNLEDFVDDSFFQFGENNNSLAMEVSNSDKGADDEGQLDVLLLLKHRIEMIGKTIENLKSQLNEKQQFHFKFIKSLKERNQVICENSLHLKYPLDVISHWLRIINHQLILGIHLINTTVKSVSNLNIILDTCIHESFTYETKFFKKNGLQITTASGNEELITESNQSIYILIKIDIEQVTTNFDRINQIIFNIILCCSYEKERILQIPLPTFQLTATNIYKDDHRIHFETESFSLEDLLSLLTLCSIQSTLHLDFIESNSSCYQTKIKFIKYLKKLQFNSFKNQESYWFINHHSKSNTQLILIHLHCHSLEDQVEKESLNNCSPSNIKFNIFTLCEQDQFVFMHYLKENIPEKFIIRAHLV